MNGELFRAARDHHGAMAAYCHALAGIENLENSEDLENLEDLVQDVLGASLRYRAALDRLIGRAQAGSNEACVGGRRLATLRSMLHFTSRRSNTLAKLQRPHP